MIRRHKTKQAGPSSEGRQGRVRSTPWWGNLTPPYIDLPLLTFFNTHVLPLLSPYNCSITKLQVSKPTIRPFDITPTWLHRKSDVGYSFATRSISPREAGGRTAPGCLVCSSGKQALDDKLNRDSRSMVNEAAVASPVQPIVNMGQGFL